MVWQLLLRQQHAAATRLPQVVQLATRLLEQACEHCTRSSIVGCAPDAVTQLVGVLGTAALLARPGAARVCCARGAAVQPDDAG